jgi:molybdopterin synthase sulfur carrier subunit
MKLLYFAWLRQKIGKAEETLDVPAHVTQVGQLLDWLESLGPNYATALKERRAVKVAVNQDYVGLTHPVKAGDEVALFPPVTGG